MPFVVHPVTSYHWMSSDWQANRTWLTGYGGARSWKSRVSTAGQLGLLEISMAIIYYRLRVGSGTTGA